MAETREEKQPGEKKTDKKVGVYEGSRAEVEGRGYRRIWKGGKKTIKKGEKQEKVLQLVQIRLSHRFFFFFLLHYFLV